MRDNIKDEILSYSIGSRRLVYWGEDKGANTLQTKIMSSAEFAETQLHQKILAATAFLDIFDPPLWYRVKTILMDSTELQKCPNCGKPCKLNLKPSAKDLFDMTCGSKTCQALLRVKKRDSKPMSEKTRALHSESQTRCQTERLQQCKHILETYDSSLTLDRELLLAWLKAKLNSQVKNGLLIRKDDYLNNQRMLHMLLKATEFIEIPDQLESITDMKFSERIYCALNQRTDVGRCKFCGDVTEFVGIKFGYRDSCPNCQADKLRRKLGNKTAQEAYEAIDQSKYEIIQFPKVFTKEPLVIRCKRCGMVSETWLINGRSNHIEELSLCKSCDRYCSKPETELRKFIQEIYTGTIQTNTREIIAPLELDIYLPDRKLAFEFDGLYYHNDDAVKSNYHILKTSKCEKAGIQLIHVFENEWRYQREIVKSRIKSLLGVHDHIIYARKCQVKTLSTSVSRAFQQANHIQGPVSAKVHLGLYYGDELISVMTFGKTRYSKKYEWELLRFCNKLGYHVPGAAGKLLKYFEQNWKPKSLVSYADRRWSVGKLYEALGFTCMHKSSPNYWYYNWTQVLESRVKYQKHKLKSKLDKFDPTLSEAENMKANGYKRIFDSGNRVYAKTY